MTTKTKTNYLVSEVMSVIKNSYHDWYVGTTNRGDIWRTKKPELIIFNVVDDEATQAAYEYLVSLGMVGRKPVGTESYYLYLQRVDGGMLPDGFTY